MKITTKVNLHKHTQKLSLTQVLNGSYVTITTNTVSRNSVAESNLFHRQRLTTICPPLTSSTDEESLTLVISHLSTGYIWNGIPYGSPLLSASPCSYDTLLYGTPTWYTRFISDLGLHRSKYKQEPFWKPVLSSHYKH